MNKGAYYTGSYTNYFAALGIDDATAEKRIDEIFQTLFYGDEDTRIYHEADPDMGYLVDTGNIDVRTEGMSYGMMISVQLNRKSEFDRIWKWVFTNMYLEKGPNKGFFCWSNSLDGLKNAGGPAPDGEEYFAMALLFASNRWGDGEGVFDYRRHACDILHCMRRIGENGRCEDGSGRGMYDPDNHLIRFICEVDFSDPSYHLPHFYELFGEWAYPEDREFYKEAAKCSREFLHKACHHDTGLSAEYSYFDGTPYDKGMDIWGRHDWYYSDAYRTIMNIAMDHIWYGVDDWQMDEGKRFLDFFCNKLKRENWDCVPEWDGTLTEKKALHPVAVIASNACAAILADDENGIECMKHFLNTPLREGNRRYYDNLLYMFAYMMLSGNYRIIRGNDQ